MGNRWGNSGNSVRLCFLGSKITADGDCSHEIKRCLLFERKVLTNLDNILKSRDITLPSSHLKDHLVKAMVFPAVMYGCDSWILKRVWILKNSEHWKKTKKNWFFWTVLLEKTLESLGQQGDPTSPSFFFFFNFIIKPETLYLFCQTSKRIRHRYTCAPGNNFWIFIGKTDAEAKTPILGHVMWKADLFEKPWRWKRLKVEREGDYKGWYGLMASLTQWTWV